MKTFAKGDIAIYAEGLSLETAEAIVDSIERSRERQKEREAFTHMIE